MIHQAQQLPKFAFKAHPFRLFHHTEQIILSGSFSLLSSVYSSIAAPSVCQLNVNGPLVFALHSSCPATFNAKAKKLFDIRCETKRQHSCDISPSDVLDNNAKMLHFWGTRPLFPGRRVSRIVPLLLECGDVYFLMPFPSRATWICISRLS